MCEWEERENENKNERKEAAGWLGSDLSVALPVPELVT